MKKGQLNQHQVANVKQTIINLQKAYNRINQTLQINNKRKYKAHRNSRQSKFKAAGEGRALVSHRGTSTVSYGTTLYLMLSEGLRSSIT